METAIKMEVKKTVNKNTYLIAENKLVLHTDVARVLFNGTWHYSRMGLLQFAKLLAPLWKAFKEDDPYAEQTLIKISNAIEVAKIQLQDHEISLQQQLENLRGLVVDLYRNPQPFSYPLKFFIPPPFLAAMLIAQVDYVNRQLFTLTRLGLKPNENLVPAQLMHIIRSIFRLPLEWKYTGVTRKDIFEGNQKAQKIKTLFGAVSVEILNKKLNS